MSTIDPFELSQSFPAAPKYLILLYLYEREHEAVMGTRLSKQLGVSTSAVTQSLGRLLKRGLVEHDTARTYRLSPDGLDLSRLVIRRHYLLERLLVDELGVAWDVADEEAEHLQLSLTARMEAIISERLGHPTTCPHGNPFPGSPREQEILAAPSLTTLQPGATGALVRVTEQGEMVPGLLTYCVELGMRIGAAVRILAVARDVVEVELNGEHVRIPWDIARHLCINAA